MGPAAVLDLFRGCGALLEGHFALSSGLHSGGYLQCARVLQHPRHAEALGAALAGAAAAGRPDAVLSPALGGLVIGHEVARACGVRALFAERVDGKLTLRRGFAVSPGERVLIVEDVVTTGGSTRETMAVAREAGGEVIGTAAIIDRSGSAVRFDAPLHVLATVDWPAYDPRDCPLCARGAPIDQPGSRPAASRGRDR